MFLLIFFRSPSYHSPSLSLLHIFFSSFLFISYPFSFPKAFSFPFSWISYHAILHSSFVLSCFYYSFFLLPLSLPFSFDSLRFHASTLLFQFFPSALFSCASTLHTVSPPDVRIPLVSASFSYMRFILRGFEPCGCFRYPLCSHALRHNMRFILRLFEFFWYPLCSHTCDLSFGGSDRSDASGVHFVLMRCGMACGLSFGGSDSSGIRELRFLFGVYSFLLLEVWLRVLNSILLRSLPLFHLRFELFSGCRSLPFSLAFFIRFTFSASSSSCLPGSGLCLYHLRFFLRLHSPPPL